MRSRLFSLFFLLSFALAGQSALPFEAVLWEQHPPEYYREQAELWHQRAYGEYARDNDWYHFYKYAQYANRYFPEAYDLDGILADAEKLADPNGFSLPYLRFARDFSVTSRYQKLLQVYRNSTYRREPLTGLTAYYELNGEVENRNRMLSRLQREHPLPAGLMDYNYNQLQSVSEGAILLTFGDGDTFPSWVLQTEFGVRRDVTVVNYHLLANHPGYRERRYADWGLSDTTFSAAKFLDDLRNRGRAVYLSMTLQLPEILDRSDRLFVTGLAMRYERVGYQNIDELVDNYTHRWRKERLFAPLADNYRQAVADQLNVNYLPAIRELLAHFPRRNPQYPKLAQLADEIARRTDNVEVQTYVSQMVTPAIDVKVSKTPGLNAKSIARRYVDLPFAGKSIGMGITEVSNADYQLFIDDLTRTGDSALAVRYAPRPVDLGNHFTFEIISAATLHGENKETIGLPDHPVVNISHEAARQYANWLTQVYNQTIKAGERPVRFRLPTAAEFRSAYSGGNNTPFPWGGPYFANRLGCLLLNFDSYGMPAADRARIQHLRAMDKRNRGACTEHLLTTAVSSFHPNNFGLFNMAGNVAEMTDQAGETVGGSFLDPIDATRRGAVTTRELPHLSTGFRLILEYVN